MLHIARTHLTPCSATTRYAQFLYIAHQPCTLTCSASSFVQLMRPRAVHLKGLSSLLDTPRTHGCHLALHHRATFLQFCRPFPQDHSPLVWCFLGPVSVIPVTLPVERHASPHPQSGPLFLFNLFLSLRHPPVLDNPSNSSRAPLTSTQASVWSSLPQC